MGLLGRASAASTRFAYIGVASVCGVALGTLVKRFEEPLILPSVLPTAAKSSTMSQPPGGKRGGVDLGGDGHIPDSL